MKFIGNYSSWINPAWIIFLKQTRGLGRPIEGKTSNSDQARLEREKAIMAGYDQNTIQFYQFSDKNFPFAINPPFIKDKFDWWIIKMLPGNFVPMHIDPHTIYQPDAVRYWMPLQDWEPGHVFMYNNTVVADYKAGDVYQWDDAKELHGACNIGHTLRLAFQFSTTPSK